jgi:tryptophanyl-tRNA synthetase
MAISNIKDILSFGFNPEKTFIFLDTEYIQYLYPNTLRVQKLTTLNQMKGIFGFNDSDNVGKYAYPPV